MLKTPNLACFYIATIQLRSEIGVKEIQGSKCNISIERKLSLDLFERIDL